MKNVKRVLAAILCVCLLCSNTVVFAHSGRTDSSGGHHDYKNKSGLGSYHYHCDGNPPHLHKNGNAGQWPAGSPAVKWESAAFT